MQPRGVVAYDLKDGAELWWVSGLFGGGIPSPGAGDGLVFAVAHFPGGDPEDRMKFPVFEDLVKKYDTNKDGLLGQKELPNNLVFYNRGSTNPDDNIVMDDMFPFIDKNRDGRLSREEWSQVQNAFAKRETQCSRSGPAVREKFPRNTSFGRNSGHAGSALAALLLWPPLRRDERRHRLLLRGSNGKDVLSAASGG